VSTVILLTGLPPESTRGMSLKALFHIVDEAMEMKEAELKAQAAKSLF